jgi:hypothetical protein
MTRSLSVLSLVFVRVYDRDQTPGTLSNQESWGAGRGREKKKKFCVFEHARAELVSSVRVLVLIFLERSKTIT